MRRLLPFVLAASMLPFAASAADISVMPVSLSLGARQDRQAVTITNQGDAPVMLQVEAVAWSQRDGEDHYAPTRELIVNPPMFTVGNGKSQIVRVGLRDPQAGPQEAAYRLIVRQVPAPEAVATQPFAGEMSDPGQIRVLLQLRLPVYVAPAQPQREQQWRAWRTPAGNVAVEILNKGNVHQTITGLTMRSSDPIAPQATGSSKVSASVLPGQTRRWELRPTGAAAPSRIELEAETDSGPQRVSLALENR